MSELEQHALEVIRKNNGTPWENLTASPIYDAACGRYLSWLLSWSDAVELREPSMARGTITVTKNGKTQTFADASSQLERIVLACEWVRDQQGVR